MYDPGPVLASIVEEACRLILPLWRTGLTVHAKADESPVTEADRQAETLILQRLAQAFPDIPVVSEEHASEFGAPGAIGPRFFLVDPIDGTKAFVRGDAHFTVNIGLIDKGNPVSGSVGAPATGQIWFTAEGGVQKRQIGEEGGQPVRVRPWPKSGAVALGSHTLRPESADWLAKHYGFDELQRMDSSLKFCILAQGDADIYARHGPTMEWDTAAGHALLLAAGGSLTDTNGKPFLYGKADAGFLNGGFVARGG